MTDLGAPIAKGRFRFAFDDGKCDTDLALARGRGRRQQCHICFPLRLQNALSIVDIRVLDHLIVAGKPTVSFAERGLI